MRDKFNAEQWKLAQTDILWSELPPYSDQDVIMTWPNMPVTKNVLTQCHKAFDDCIIGREFSTRFVGCVLNEQSRRIDAMFAVQKRDACKPLFCSARNAVATDYNEPIASWLDASFGVGPSTSSGLVA